MMGNRLKDLLNREGVTAYRIWKDLGIDQGHLSRFISGKQSISLHKLELIADYLGYDIDFVKRPSPPEKGAIQWEVFSGERTVNRTG
jgi:transcriptional regulator with XRE-family HTH domain